MIIFLTITPSNNSWTERFRCAVNLLYIHCFWCKHKGQGWLTIHIFMESKTWELCPWKLCMFHSAELFWYFLVYTVVPQQPVWMCSAASNWSCCRTPRSENNTHILHWMFECFWCANFMCNHQTSSTIWYEIPHKINHLNTIQQTNVLPHYISTQCKTELLQATTSGCWSACFNCRTSGLILMKFYTRHPHINKSNFLKIITKAMLTNVTSNQETP